MATRKRLTGQPGGPGESRREAPRPEALFERLVHQVRQQEPVDAAKRSDGAAGEVLLQLDRVDVRYELVRKPRSRPAVRLAPRQLEVALLVARGFSAKRIAMQLGLRVPTVNTYTQRLFLRFGVHTRAELVGQLASGFLEWLESQHV